MPAIDLGDKCLPIFTTVATGNRPDGMRHSRTSELPEAGA